MDKQKNRLALALSLLKTNFVLATIATGMILYARCTSQAASYTITLGTPVEIKVMVIDTGIDAEHPMLKSYVKQVSSNIDDDHGHGTHVAGLIIYGSLNKYKERGLNPTKALGLCPEVKLYICKFFSPKSTPPNAAIQNGIECLKEALRYKVDYVNYSAGGPTFSQEEYDALEELEEAGIRVFAAAGNDGFSIEKNPYYPAGYSVDKETEIETYRYDHISGKQEKVTKKEFRRGLTNITVVGNLSRDGNGNLNQATTTNYGLPKMSWAVGTDRLSTLPKGKLGLMTGTSQSVPIYLHRILRNQCNLLKEKKK